MADGGGDSVGWRGDRILISRKRRNKDNAETQRDAEERREGRDESEARSGVRERDKTR